MTSHPTAVETTRRIDTGEVALSVAEYGDGPPLLLIHGVGTRGVTWWPVIDALAARFRLIVPDLRGHGASDKPASGYHVLDYAADLAGLLDALALDRPRIIGHSLGGLVTLAWAIVQPGRAACIVLEDVPLRAGSRSGELFDEWIALAAMPVAEAAAHYRRENPAWSEEDCLRRAESITMTAPAVFTELRDGAAASDSPDRLAALAVIESPLLLVHGDLETGGMVVPEDAARLAGIVPNSDIVRVPGGSHSLHRDQKDAFLAAVLPFFDRHG